MRWTQFFEKFVCSDNLLIINILHLNSSFFSSNAPSNPLIFRFLFRHSSNTYVYTLLNILAVLRHPFFRFLLFFYFQRTVLEFSAHSERISTALQIKLQCAENVTTVRWKFENLVVFFKDSSPEINKCKRTVSK